LYLIIPLLIDFGSGAVFLPCTRFHLVAGCEILRSIVLGGCTFILNSIRMGCYSAPACLLFHQLLSHQTDMVFFFVKAAAIVLGGCCSCFRRMDPLVFLLVLIIVCLLVLFLLLNGFS
jgi:hypothetical protein